MEWNLDESRPIWIQLMEGISMRIMAGIYEPGSRLPSVRELAGEAGVNPNTMQRAFSELESKGLVVTNRTAGRCVTQDMEIIRKVRDAQAKLQVKEFLKKMQALGYTQQEIKDVFEKAFEEG